MTAEGAMTRAAPLPLRLTLPQRSALCPQLSALRPPRFALRPPRFALSSFRFPQHFQHIINILRSMGGIDLEAHGLVAFWHHREG